MTRLGIGGSADRNSGGRSRVLVVDDSALVRHLMREVLLRDVRFEVAVAADPIIAMRKMKEDRPHVILLDLTMPRMDGLSFLERIMDEDPIPVVICSVLARESTEVAVRALAYGAVDVLSKPVVERETGAYSASDATLITETLHAASFARVTPRRSALRRPIAPPSPARSTPAPEPRNREAILAVGASTGGPAALEELVLALPATAPAVVVVQHMPGAFTSALAKRLNSISPLEVKEARDGERVRPGRVLVAPGDRHMTLAGRPGRHRVELIQAPLVNHHRPSVDVLFESVARCSAENGIGVLLTGMGEDGVAGLEAMKKAGASTIAQDEATSVVFGMPKQAIARGVVDSVLPLGEIARAVMEVAGRRTRRAAGPPRGASRDG